MKMKKNYKLYIRSTAPIVAEEINYIEKNLPEHLHGRLETDEENPQIASIIVSADSSGNPDLDEVTDLILALDDSGSAVYFGYPLDDDSNAVSDNNWELLEKCKV